ncbi:MAG: DUF99 family protein [Thermoplasmatales archaeon]|nr:DUF99 family protein [Thermoplasmatales archaeon]
MKTQYRTMGIDDAPFKFRDRNVSVVGAVVRGNSYLEGVLKTEVMVDGRNANKKLSGMINNSRFREQIKVVMIDGAALGGFNVVDIGKLYKDTGVPVITITRNKPDYTKIKSALRKHFKDWERRYEIITKNEIFRIKTKHNPIHVGLAGITLNKAETIIRQTTLRGALPETVRIAHLIATGITKGESYGKA